MPTSKITPATHTPPVTHTKTTPHLYVQNPDIAHTKRTFHTHKPTTRARQHTTQTQPHSHSPAPTEHTAHTAHNEHPDPIGNNPQCTPHTHPKYPWYGLTDYRPGIPRTPHAGPNRHTPNPTQRSHVSSPHNNDNTKTQPHGIHPHTHTAPATTAPTTGVAQQDECFTPVRTRTHIIQFNHHHRTLTTTGTSINACYYLPYDPLRVCGGGFEHTARSLSTPGVTHVTVTPVMLVEGYRLKPGLKPGLLVECRRGDEQPLVQAWKRTPRRG